MNYVFGNLLSADRGIIVHGCNAKGVMGSGVALAVRQKYPNCFLAYANHIEKLNKQSKKLLGSVAWYEVDPLSEKTLVIANAITQEFYGRENIKYASYDAIYDSFDQIIDLASKANEVIHIPLIGCGLGGLDWRVVSELIQSVSNKYGYNSDNINVWQLS